MKGSETHSGVPSLSIATTVLVEPVPWTRTSGRPSLSMSPTAGLAVESLAKAGSVTDHSCSPVSPRSARTTPCALMVPAM